MPPGPKPGGIRVSGLGQVVGRPDKLSPPWLTASNSTCYAAEMETSTATISVLQVTAIHAGRVLALADVELILDGVSLVIHGVQVRADASKTEITLPNYRAPDGSWRTAVTLPDEVRGPMGDAVIAAAMEIGILMEKAAVV